jgi:predicted GH43/DUF377 family glycosyl hydrolase
MNRLRRAGLAAALLLAACGRYADFTLPPPEGAAAAVTAAMTARDAAVLEPGPPGSFDSVDLLNPAIVKHRGEYLCLYSGFDGKTWHTGVAVSRDGVQWTKRGKILSPDAAAWEGAYIAANGAVIAHGGELLYWYQAGEPPRIGLARSRDGIGWRKHPAPVLGGGPRGSWDERAVADPYVFSSAGWLFLAYLGEDRARRQRLGLARSRDGVQWEKLRSSPILELGPPGAFDENGLGEPALWSSHGRWWMLYTGRDRKEFRRLGLAYSTDGVRWQRYSEAAVLQGAAPWNNKVVCDPEVEMTPEGVRVWFGGGDVAHPAENVHGRIGLAFLRFEASR